MSIFTLSKFAADSIQARADYFEFSADTLSSFYLGSAAGYLGLQGKPEPGHYLALMTGYLPASGESLLSDHRRKCLLSPRTVIGFSTSLNLHKSLSVLYAGMGEEDQQAFLGALTVASHALFSELESVLFFGSKTGRGGSGYIKGDSIALAYVHCTNRALEPHLHIHVEIPNLCLCTDGQWRTLAAVALYDRQIEVARIFDKYLVSELSARFPWLRDRFWSDDRGVSIPSVPSALIEAASTRRKEVVEALGHGSETNLDAVYATRQHKNGIDTAGLIVSWREQFCSAVQALRG